MWELGFEVVELARATSHGREHGRTEERVRVEQHVVVIREDGKREVAEGFSLDRSAKGARVFVTAKSDFAIGELLKVYMGSDFFVARVVWGYAEEDAWVLGLERDDDEIEVIWAA